MICLFSFSVFLLSIWKIQDRWIANRKSKSTGLWGIHEKKMTSRKAILERQRAISAARNIKDSSFGKCVLRTNSVYDRLLTTTKTCLDHELKRKQMHGDQERKQFLNKLLLTTNPPSLIVERPPSPDVCRPSMYGGDWPEAPDYEMNEPRYMRPLKSRTRTPSNLPTIDAFKVRELKLWFDLNYLF